MRVKIVKICARSPTVYIEPVFRYRTPKSDRLARNRSFDEGINVACLLACLLILNRRVATRNGPGRFVRGAVWLFQISENDAASTLSLV
jgi:hypothetical protein